MPRFARCGRWKQFRRASNKARIQARAHQNTTSFHRRGKIIMPGCQTSFSFNGLIVITTTRVKLQDQTSVLIVCMWQEILNQHTLPQATHTHRNQSDKIKRSLILSILVIWSFQYYSFAFAHFSNRVIVLGWLTSTHRCLLQGTNKEIHRIFHIFFPL